MQRYRVNYVLLIGLLVGTLVCSGGVYALWKFQVEKNSGRLLERAAEAEQEGDLRAATRHYSQYLTVNPGDNQAQLKFATAYLGIAEYDDVNIKELMQLFTIVEDTLRRIPDADELRREIIDLYIKYQKSNDALEHAKILLSRHPDDGEIKAIMARCLMLAKNYRDAQRYSYELIGYDSASGTFDLEEAEAPHHPIVYRNLADLLQRDDMADLANRVMNQMVEANPDSHEAYLLRGSYYQRYDQEELAGPDIRKAFELAPEEPNTRLALAEMLIQQKDGTTDEERATDGDVAKAKAERIEKAIALLEEGLEQASDDVRFHRALAATEIERQNYAAALERVNAGIKAVSRRDSITLLAYKADLQLREEDLDGIAQTIQELRDIARPDYIDWIRARVMLVENEWFEASKLLRKVRPSFAQVPQVQTQIDVQLGLCYEKLGQPERAKESYQLALNRDANNEPARLGVQRVDARLMPSGSPLEPSWQARIAEEAKKPKEEQDWTKIDEQMEEVAEKMQLSEAGRLLLEAELLMIRGDYKAAREQLRKAYAEAPDTPSIRRAAVRLVAKDPEQGPVKALRLLDKMIEDFGDGPTIRIEKADLYIANNDEQLAQQLESLTDGMEDWPVEEQSQVWYGLAGRYFQLGMRDEALRCWNKVTELSPNDLPTRMMLFTLAYEANDDAAMKAAQDRILEVVKDKEDNVWLFTEARRKLSQLRRGKLGKEAIADIRKLVSRAADQRPDWHELHLLRAELALLEGNPNAALEHFQTASQLGRPYPAATLQHVQLLVSRGRFRDARQAVESLPTATRERMLGRLYAEILFNVGEVDQAVQAAEKVIEQDPENGTKQLWYGQLMARVAQLNGVPEDAAKSADEKAAAAIARSVELIPEEPQAWLALVSYQMFKKDRAGAEQTLREAQLALSSDQLPMVLAKSYEMMGRAFDAENLYLSVYESNPDNLAMARMLANFYLSSPNRYDANQRVAKATPYINDILSAQEEGKVGPNDDNVVWARRTAAQILARSGQYQNLLKAEKLLASNARDGKLSMQDRLQMAQILAPRPEPISRQKARALLEEVKANQRLNESAELVLGQLYFALGDWPKCRRQMDEVTSRFPESVAARDSYIRMLLRRGSDTDLRTATHHLEKLMSLAPNRPQTLELIARVSAKRGREQQARAALLRVLPKDLKELNEEQLPLAEQIADLLLDLEDYDTALQIHQFIASKNNSKVFKFARLLGIHRDVDQSMELLGKVFNSDTAAAVVQQGIAIVRARRDDVGDQHDKQIQAWLDAALRENPGSVPLLMQQAEFYDLQERYEDAAETYSKLLSRKDLQGLGRAIVLNNLSYLLALTGTEASINQSMSLIQEAVRILGPTADILDTRAVVSMARGDYEAAIADLELSLTDNPTANKYFHKAQAHLGAGQNNDAIDAWHEALEMGLSREEVNRMERSKFDTVKQRIQELETLNANYSHERPLAG